MYCLHQSQTALENFIRKILPQAEIRELIRASLAGMLLAVSPHNFCVEHTVMTLMPVKDGIFRAFAQSDNRGRRKRRGEFFPVGVSATEFTGTRIPVLRDEGDVVFPAPSARSISESEGRAELRVRQEDNGDARTTLWISGTLDLATVLPFRDAVFTAIGAKPLALVLDVTRVRDIDTVGIFALVTAGRVARLMKVAFSVTPSPSLRTLLEETGICRTVSITESRK